MDYKDFNKKIESKEAKVLTLDAAKSLKGKRIVWTYFGYGKNEQQVYESIIGDIVSALDYQETQPCEGFASRADSWRSFMSPEELQKEKETLYLIDKNGKDTYMRCHSEWKNYFRFPTFTCSDVDREVYYLVLEDE